MLTELNVNIHIDQFCQSYNNVLAVLKLVSFLKLIAKIKDGNRVLNGTEKD